MWITPVLRITYYVLRVCGLPLINEAPQHSADCVDICLGTNQGGFVTETELSRDIKLSIQLRCAACGVPQELLKCSTIPAGALGDVGRDGHRRSTDL